MNVDSDSGGPVALLRDPAESRLADATAHAAPVADHKGLVLVVDDEPQVRTVNTRFLQSLGYDVIQAHNAYEAAALFGERHREVSAVILDLRMPGKDGWTCLSELRAIRARIPVVICSGYDPEHHHLDKAHRHLAFLHKPFRIDDLDAVLRSLLGPVGLRPR